MDVQSKRMSFRRQSAPRHLYPCGLRWQDTADILLQRVGRLGYSKQLFLVTLEEVDHTVQCLKYSGDPDVAHGFWENLDCITTIFLPLVCSKQDSSTLDILSQNAKRSFKAFSTKDGQKVDQDPGRSF